MAIQFNNKANKFEAKTASGNLPQFQQAARRALQSSTSAFEAVVSMVQYAPNELKNSPKFAEVDRALKMFQQAINALEKQAGVAASHWTGTR